MLGIIKVVPYFVLISLVISRLDRIQTSNLFAFYKDSKLTNCVVLFLETELPKRSN